MKMTKYSTTVMGSLLVAATASALGQEASNAASSTNTVPDKVVTPAVQAKSAPAEKSGVRFEGTDLKLGRLPPITFHGFASQGLLASTDYNYLGKSKQGLGSAEFNEFGINASISPFPRTRIALQAFTFDLGNVGNYALGLDYGLVDYNFCDEFGVRGGRIRRPQGIYNHIQDVDLARTSVLLPQGMYDARWRDFSASVDGGSFYGNVGLGKAGSFSYEAYAGMINLSEEGGVARQLQGSLNRAPISSYGKVNDCPVIGAQFWWMTPVEGLRTGFTLSEALGFVYDYRVNPPFGPGALSSESDVYQLQYSLEYQIKSWIFQAEYKSQNVVSHNMFAGNIISRGRSHGDSWYVGAAYRFNKWLEAGSYYTEYYANVNNRSGDGTATPSDAYQKDLALSLRFDPKPWWVIKLEIHGISGTGLLYDNASNPVRDDDVWYMLAAKTTFSF